MNTNIPLVDLQAQYQSIKSEIDAAIHLVLDSSQYILGKAVSEFEEAFARSHNCKYCVGVGSGTDALHLALWIEGIGYGDEVITVPFTFIATAEAVSLTGAKPVFVDIDPVTYTLDPAKLEASITSRTKAVIAVHLYGQAADMDPIVSICKKHGLILIEDAAQAHLARYNQRSIGEFGSTTCFSFYPGKNLGAYGEAGAVVTNDEKRAAHLRQLRDHGQSRKYQHAMLGHNYRMDGIQGAVLVVKLKYLPKWTERRREIADFYRARLKDIDGIQLPHERQGAYHVYHQFMTRTAKRNDLQNYLADRGVSTGLHYPVALHMQEAYRHLSYKHGDFPESEKAAEECLSFPIYPEMTDVQLEQVVRNVGSFFGT